MTFSINFCNAKGNEHSIVSTLVIVLLKGFINIHFYCFLLLNEFGVPLQVLSNSNQMDYYDVKKN
jgi:hypothetical protein